MEAGGHVIHKVITNMAASPCLSSLSHCGSKDEHKKEIISLAKLALSTERKLFFWDYFRISETAFTNRWEDFSCNLEGQLFKSKIVFYLLMNSSSRDTIFYGKKNAYKNVAKLVLVMRKQKMSMTLKSRIFKDVNNVQTTSEEIIFRNPTRRMSRIKGFSSTGTLEV